MNNRYPHGKLNDTDEGELLTAVGVENGNVRIDFGKPVAWVGFDPQGAADFATVIIKHARRAAKAAGVVLTVTIGGDE